jgi:hypothetical protein
MAALLPGKREIMIPAKAIGGVLLVLIGLVWIGQGMNMIKGSGMSDHPIWAVIGLVIGAVGVWLFWSAARAWARTKKKSFIASGAVHLEGGGTMPYCTCQPCWAITAVIACSKCWKAGRMRRGEKSSMNVATRWATVLGENA